MSEPTVERCRHCGCEFICPDCDGSALEGARLVQRGEVKGHPRPVSTEEGGTSKVIYLKDMPVNASEVVAVHFLMEIGRLQEGESILPTRLAVMLGEALLESDDSLKQFVKRYAVVL